MKFAAAFFFTGIVALAADSKLADAAMHHDTQAVATLLAQKTEPNAIQADGTTALMWAVIENHLDVAKLLIARGAEVESGFRYAIGGCAVRADHVDRWVHGPNMGTEERQSSPAGDRWQPAGSRHAVAIAFTGLRICLHWSPGVDEPRRRVK